MSTTHKEAREAVKIIRDMIETGYQPTMVEQFIVLDAFDRLLADTEDLYE